MRARPGFLSLAVILCSESALAQPGDIAVTAGQDLAGQGSAKVVATAIRQALAAAGMSVADDASLAKALRATKIKAKALKAAQAAKLAVKGRFAAVVIHRKGKGGVFAQVIDARGRVLLERLIHVAKGHAVDSDATAFASGAAQALGGSTTPPPTPVEAPALTAAAPPADTGAAPTTTTIASASAAPAESGPAATVTASPSTGESGTEGTERAAGFLLRVGLLGGAGERMFLAPGFAYTTSSPYLYGGVTVEAYPFSSLGLGVMADFAMGLVTDQLAGGTGTFSSNDFRGDVCIDYRLQLGPVGTFLVPRVGAGLRRFDPPNTIGTTGLTIHADDRLFFEAGLQVMQPILGPYLRVTVGAAALPLANTNFYPNSSGFGLQWMAELGGDLLAGLEWGLQVDQERFLDSYTTPAKDSGVEVETGYTLQLRYRL